MAEQNNRLGCMRPAGWTQLA